MLCPCPGLAEDTVGTVDPVPGLGGLTTRRVGGASAKWKTGAFYTADSQGGYIAGHGGTSGEVPRLSPDGAELGQVARSRQGAGVAEAVCLEPRGSGRVRARLAR